MTKIAKMTHNMAAANLTGKVALVSGQIINVNGGWYMS
jgi:hypothetical protein